jgi:hypothetical protein
MNEPARSGERQRVDVAQKGNLPRLQPELYRGLAYVHWTLTVEQRRTGWLTNDFKHRWDHILTHACARYKMACPVYVLMPDHIHLCCSASRPSPTSEPESNSSAVNSGHI